ncbi:MAG: hypothetical protein IKT27_04760 [Clostridia bacterium]|nr:hypothetical protein [Clostridia bacterium]
MSLLAKKPEVSLSVISYYERGIRTYATSPHHACRIL